MKLTALLSAVVAVAFTAGVAFAEDAAAPAAAAPMAADKAAKSAECSKEADAKSLHGKARKKFRAECKKGKM
jgi:hypothetical protein